MCAKDIDFESNLDKLKSYNSKFDILGLPVPFIFKTKDNQIGIKDINEEYLSHNDGKITIPDFVTAIYRGAFSNNKLHRPKAIILKDLNNVKYIADFAFVCGDNLLVSFTDRVTLDNNMKISTYSFIKVSFTEVKLCDTIPFLM